MRWRSTPTTFRVSARFGISQMLRAGITTVAETTCTESHEAPIAETIMATGIRAAMARGMPDRQSHLASNYEQVDERSWYRDDPGLLEQDLAVTEEFLRRWQRDGEGRLRPYVHNLGVPSCSDQRFLETRALAERFGTRVMCHINRDREEIELAISLFGERPLEHLHTIGAIGEGFLAIHAMLTTDREIEMLAQAGGAVAHAPVVCTDIVSAVTKVPTMRASGVVVGLGCDTVINDILKIARIAFIMHTQGTGIPMYDPYGFTTEDALTMGTIDAARALGWDDEIGSLEVGKAARRSRDRRRQRAPDPGVRPGRDARSLRQWDRRRDRPRRRSASRRRWRSPDRAAGGVARPGRTGRREARCSARSAPLSPDARGGLTGAAARRHTARRLPRRRPHRG